MIPWNFGGNRSSTYFRKLSLLVFSTIVVLLSALYLLFAVKNEGNSILHLQLVEHADRIAENFNDRLHADLLALHAFSLSLTSYGLDAENHWPLISIPDFGVRSWTTRQEMRAETLGLLPIVTEDKRQDWENFVMENHDWIEQARSWEEKNGVTSNPDNRLLLEHSPINRKPEGRDRNLQLDASFSDGISSSIYRVNVNGEAVVDEGMGPFSPIWMTSPAPMDSRMINFNMLSHHLFWQAIEDCMYSGLSVLSRVLNYDSMGESRSIAGSGVKLIEEPISSILYPVFDNFEDNSDLVAIVAAEIYWHNLLEVSLSGSGSEIICVIETACDQKFSFKIDGHETTFLGPGDYHDPLLSKMVQTRGPKELVEKAEGFTGYPLDLGHCPFLLHIYPASRMKESVTPFGIFPLTLCILALLVFPTFIFFCFRNLSSELRERDVESAKMPSLSRVPLRRGIIGAGPRLWKKRRPRNNAAPQRVIDVIENLPEGVTSVKSNERVILTNTTLMIAGICSLEKWGDGKDHEETTHLLETVQRSILALAKRHGISQIEMIDGNFVAIVGSDNSDADHAAILVYFACECRKRLSELFKSMSAKELSVRFGIHSGNLKPEIKCNDNGSSRFQLFGNTVDIAHQMLENGKGNRIHVSVDTAELLNLAGKSHWISPRSDLVAVTGVGNMSTFWVLPKACLSAVRENQSLVNLKNDDDSETISSEGNNWNGACGLHDISEKDFDTLVDQNTTILLRYLRAIYARRLASKQKQQRILSSPWESGIEIGASILEEARETVQASLFDLEVSMNSVDPSLIEVSQEVQSQLRVYVASIGTAHRGENPFHNFQHASHTLLVMDQMIMKITSQSNILQTGFDGTPRSKGEIAKELNARSFSIDSDPIIQFAMVFSALIHDVDHIGVSNQQLVKNGSPLSTLYKKRCVSEQNSVDISWWLLMTADFDDLRSAIYSNASEKRRFRQVLVNSVIATDFLDSKMQQHRDANWNKVFAESVKRRNHLDANEKRNLQVTWIIECTMQFADSSYRGQCYRSYLKWNERLFEEELKAYHSGRLEVNPAVHWYKSELSHFDTFLIPVLSRLINTGIFGGSGESYLKQTTENRNAWKSGGETIVQEMVNRFSRKVVAVQEETILFT